MKQNLSLGEFATAFLNLYIQTIILWWSNIGFTCRGGSLTFPQSAITNAGKVSAPYQRLPLSGELSEFPLGEFWLRGSYRSTNSHKFWNKHKSLPHYPSVASRRQLPWQGEPLTALLQFVNLPVFLYHQKQYFYIEKRKISIYIYIALC